MAMNAGDYKRRVQATNTAAGVNAGFQNSAVHIPAGETNFKVTSATSVVTLLSINATSAATNVWFQDSAGNKQEIAMGLTVARDYKWSFYCPWDLYISTDVDCTVIVHAPSKGNTQD